MLGKCRCRGTAAPGYRFLDQNRPGWNPGATSNRSNVPSNKQVGADWRPSAGHASQALDSRWWALVLAGLRWLISVRSVVQLYPGPFLEPLTPLGVSARRGFRISVPGGSWRPFLVSIHYPWSRVAARGRPA
jgi:hypothetical protein